MQEQEVGAGGRSRRWVFDGFGGFAAFRAESRWLSVCALKITSGYAAGGEASVCGVDWSESRRHSARRAAKPPLTDRKPPATCCHLRHLLLPPAPLAPATCAACSCHLPPAAASCRCPLSPVPSFSNYLHQHPLSAAAIKFAVENLFPRAEVELAFCNRDDNFTAH